MLENILIITGAILILGVVIRSVQYLFTITEWTFNYRIGFTILFIGTVLLATGSTIKSDKDITDSQIVLNNMKINEIVYLNNTKIQKVSNGWIYNEKVLVCE